MQQAHSMKKQEKAHELISDDSITVNFERDGHIVYSSQCNPDQLPYIGNTLYNQYTFDPTTALIIPESQVLEEDFKTLKEAAKLLVNSRQQDKEKQKKEQNGIVRKIMSSERFPLSFINLFKAVDFLDCSFLFNPCLAKITQITKEFIEKGKIKEALLLFDQLNNYTLSVLIGNHLLQNSKPIGHLLTACQESILHQRENSNTTVKSPFIEILKSNSNVGLIEICVCHESNTLFLLFKDRILVYDIQNRKSLGCLYMPVEIKSVRYSPSKGVLFLIEDNIISAYQIKNNTFNLLIHLESYSVNTKIDTLTFDENNLIFYLTLNDSDKIYQYEYLNNIYRKYFQCSNIKSLCLSKDKKTLYSVSKKNNSKQSQTGEICFWNIKKRYLYNVIQIKNYWNEQDSCPLYQLEVSPDGSLLALATKRNVSLFDAQTGDYVKKFNSSFAPIAFYPNSKTLIASHKKGFIEQTLMNKKLEKELRNFPAQHIALLYACIQERKKRNGNIFEHCINLTEQTGELFDQLPKSIKAFLIS